MKGTVYKVFDREQQNRYPMQLARAPYEYFFAAFEIWSTHVDYQNLSKSNNSHR